VPPSQSDEAVAKEAVSEDCHKLSESFLSCNTLHSSSDQFQNNLWAETAADNFGQQHSTLPRPQKETSDRDIPPTPIRRRPLLSILTILKDSSCYLLNRYHIVVECLKSSLSL